MKIYLEGTQSHCTSAIFHSRWRPSPVTLCFIHSRPYLQFAIFSLSPLKSSLSSMNPFSRRQSLIFPLCVEGFCCWMVYYITEVNAVIYSFKFSCASVNRNTSIVFPFCLPTINYFTAHCPLENEHLFYLLVLLNYLIYLYWIFVTVGSIC